MDATQPKEGETAAAEEQKTTAAPDATQAQPSPDQSVPQDALEKTNEEINEDIIDATATAGSAAPGTSEDKPVKKPSGIKVFFRKVNVYLLGFGLIVVVVGAVSIVSFLNSKKVPPEVAIASQQLNQEALKKLANADTTIGSAAQTLTVQGNAIFSGQVLVRSDLNVAGNIQLGGSLQAPSLTVSGKTNLAETQINSLQVAQNTSVQGTTTLSDLNVSGAASFNAPITASQITVTRLILSGNASLTVPNHIGFPGASPGRTISQASLGAGGTVSVNGSDTAGTVNISSGAAPAAGCFINLTFNVPYSNTPRVIVSPFGSGAGSLQYYVTKSATGFSICSNSAAPANQVFGFDYFVTI